MSYCHNYISFRELSTDFSVNISDWQGVDDEPVNSSKNLIESGGVFPVKKKINDVVTDTMIVSQSINLYDKYQGLIDGYINSSGEISSGDAKTSKPTAVTSGHYYLLSGRTQESGFMIRCLDSSNNPLKVLVASTGEEINSWQLPKENGSGTTPNGQFKVPTGAVLVQFVVSYWGSGDDNSIMLTDLGDTYHANPDTPAYQRYGDTYKVDGIEELQSDVAGLNGEIDGEAITKNAQVSLNAEGKYINAANTDGEIKNYAPLALAYYPIRQGVSYHITVAQTTNQAGWELAYATTADGSSNVTVLDDYGKGTWAAATFDLDSTFDGYLVVGYATGTALPVVTYIELNDGLSQRMVAAESDI